MKRIHRAALAACILLLAAARAHADPNDYILDLDFEDGERELETKAGSASTTRDGQAAARAIALSWGIAPSDRWRTEVYGQWSKPLASDGSGGFDSVSWENVVRFSEPGERAVDVGAMLEIERPRLPGQGWNLTFGPLLQKDIYNWQVNTNVLLARSFDATADTPWNIEYQFQLKYRASRELEPGLQVFGSLKLDAPGGAAQPRDHRAGPAVFGKVSLGAGRAITYNAALLLGLGDGAASRTVRAQVEYEY